MSSNSSESESSEEEGVGEDLKDQKDTQDVTAGQGGSESAIAEGTSRILELLQEERENDSKDSNMNNGTMSQGYSKIQQSAEDMSENSSVATPRATAHMDSPDGSVVSFQDDTPSVQVGHTDVSCLPILIWFLELGILISEKQHSPIEGSKTRIQQPDSLSSSI